MTATRKDYEWDVFVSYRRWGLWPAWVRNSFKDLFEHWLGEELGETPRVFYDFEGIESGSWWDQDLALHLGRSATLVPLFTRQYFASAWCQAELSLMSERERTCSLRTRSDRRVLILPLTLHDGRKFPEEARRLQALDLHRFAFVRTAEGSPKHEALEESLKSWIPSLAKAVRRAPTRDPEWESWAEDRMQEAFASTLDPIEVPRPA